VKEWKRHLELVRLSLLEMEGGEPREICLDNKERMRLTAMTSKRQATPPEPVPAKLDEMIGGTATVTPMGESEQAVVFFTLLEAQDSLPFKTEVLE